MGEGDPGGQKPDPRAFRKQVEGHPGREKSKKLSELTKKEVLAGRKVLKTERKENSWKERGLLQN